MSFGSYLEVGDTFVLPGGERIWRVADTGSRRLIYAVDDRDGTTHDFWADERDDAVLAAPVCGHRLLGHRCAMPPGHQGTHIERPYMWGSADTMPTLVGAWLIPAVSVPSGGDQ